MNIDVFDTIDTVINTDMRGRRNRELYRSARTSLPLCLEAAKIASNSIEKGRTVIITSGFPILPEGKTETDGPCGALILARAVERLGGVPCLLADDRSRDVHVALIETAGVRTAELMTVPVASLEAGEACRAILAELEPSLLVAVEKPGVNLDGGYCDMKGNDISSFVGKVDWLFTRAMDREIPTIGIGDGGNEIGMGNIIETVRKVIPHGPRIASTTRTGSLVVSGVSNWGAYGVVAALSILTGRCLLHGAELEKKMIEACVRSGAVDGIRKKAENSVDGLPSGFHENIVERLRGLVRMNIS